MESRDKLLVVVSFYNEHSSGSLLRLLDGLSQLAAGVAYDVRVVVNQGVPESLVLPARHAAVEVLHRPNQGYNIGAWEAGWRAGPAYAGYLFLQDDCRILRAPWLAPFARRAEEPGVGLVGERLSTSWDAPWSVLEERFRGQRLPEHRANGESVDRLSAYRRFFAERGIDPGPRGDHLQTLVLFARREILEAMGGFPVGGNYGEAIASEIGTSKRVQALGYGLRQVGSRPFFCFSHPQWDERAPCSPPAVVPPPVVGPPPDAETVRVFVGADRTQMIGVWALEHSIRRNSSLPVEFYPMVDMPVPVPCDPANRQRTGFSFSRFCIPKLAGYQGKAIYLDADMLVVGDIAELWRTPLGGAKVLIQRELSVAEAEADARVGAPRERVRQCAVMVLDCERLDWDVERIVADLDGGRFTYEQLLFELCLLGDDELGCVLPFRWNSLERHDPDTRLIHYTDVYTQPWVSAKNPNDGIWLAEVREMILDGSLRWEQVEEEIALGHARPSLLWELRYGHRVPSSLGPVRRRVATTWDGSRAFVAHEALYAAKRARRVSP